jgi:capsular polysaccharide transport system permease protein
MFRSLKTQIDVIVALTIRDMQAANARVELGLAWALVEVLLYVAIISLVRVFIKAFMPPNMPPFTFLMLGILPWQTFSHTARSVETIVSKNRGLLILPIVKPLDLVFAKAIETFCIYGLMFLLLVSVSAYLEGAGLPRFPLGIVLCYLAAWLMGMSFGMILLPTQRVFPPSRWLLSPLMRIGFWTSGLYFVIASLPQSIWPYLDWNPMLHVNELMRTYWFATYTSPIGSPAYIIECLAGMALFGLSLERFIRRVAI